MKRTQNLIQIDQLNLRLPGMTRREGLRFAQHIKSGLNQRATEIRPDGGDVFSNTKNLSLKLQSYSGQSISALADHAVSQLIRQLNGSEFARRKR